jgi:hypothetical protein
VPELDPQSLGGDFAPTRSSSVYTVEIDGDAVLLDEVANRLHHLNHTAALLWACFDGRTPSQKLAAEICDELDLTYDEVLADTLMIVRQLGAEGLLEGVRATDAETADAE